VVADKFHILALAGRALQEVHGERRRRGNVAWLLQRGVERLNQVERRRLLEALSADSSLARAWGLKEAVRGVYTKKRREEAAVALANWIKDAEESGLRPFHLVEGKHNRIKTLKRRAYGYRNDSGFLLRILNLIHTD